jgi:serine/threonine protein phosphatase PrpC
MFLVDLFGGGNKVNKKKKKGKKKKLEEKRVDLSLINPLAEVKIYGYSKIGYGPKKTECQDSYCIMEKFTDDCHFLAVYDGHGSSGKEASQAANDYIQTYLEKNAKKIKTLITEKTRESFLRHGFKTAESKLKSSGIDYSNSGTCCISVFLQKNNCYIANLGDSRAVLCRITPKEKLAIELSHDHKPTRPDEKERILKSGGKVERLIHDGVPVGPYRVWLDDEGPGIAMTRTLGDLQAKKIGLISDPEIEHIELNPNDRFIVMGSDGLWDVMESNEVVGFVLQHEQRETVAEALVQEARSRWEELNRNKKKNAGIGIGDVPYLKFGCDDITAVVAYMRFHTEEELEELAKGQANAAEKKDDKKAEKK